MSRQSLDSVIHPVIGLSHIASDTAHLIDHKMQAKDSIRLYLAVQPNSHPHLGTLTTLMTTFALAKHFQEHFHVQAEITLDILENSPNPADKIEVDGVIYQRSLASSMVNGRTLADIHMDSFRAILDYLLRRTAVPYSIRPYEHFQRLPAVRRTFLEILRQYDLFAPVLSPSEKRLHFRFPCPACGYVDKNSITVKIEALSNEHATLSSMCFAHGRHSLEISPSNSDFIDSNAPLRDVAKGALLIDMDKESSVLSVTVAGGDWSGMWLLRVFCEGLSLLGLKYEGIPVRFYAPTITDWSGAKFSKSIYVTSHAYEYLDAGWLDFSKFIASYGEEGLDRLWQEVIRWAKEPSRLFRNYSVEYFELLLRELPMLEPGKS